MTKLLLIAVLALASCSGHHAEQAHRRGYEAAKAKDWTEASNAFAEAVKLDPNVAKYRYNYALALAHRGHLEHAQMEAQEAIRIDPTHKDASALLSSVGYQIQMRQRAAY